MDHSWATGRFSEGAQRVEYVYTLFRACCTCHSQCISPAVLPSSMRTLDADNAVTGVGVFTGKQSESSSEESSSESSRKGK